jgi:hypothetical protein
MTPNGPSPAATLPSTARLAPIGLHLAGPTPGRAVLR